MFKKIILPVLAVILIIVSVFLYINSKKINNKTDSVQQQSSTFSSEQSSSISETVKYGDIAIDNETSTIKYNTNLEFNPESYKQKQLDSLRVKSLSTIETSNSLIPNALFIQEFIGKSYSEISKIVDFNIAKKFPSPRPSSKDNQYVFGENECIVMYFVDDILEQAKIGGQYKFGCFKDNLKINKNLRLSLFGEEEYFEYDANINIFRFVMPTTGISLTKYKDNRVISIWLFRPQSVKEFVKNQNDSKIIKLDRFTYSRDQTCILGESTCVKQKFIEE